MISTRSCVYAWCRDCRATTVAKEADELWFVRTRRLWWTSSYVRPTLFYFTYLFISSYCFSVQLHNRLIASSSPHQTSPHQTRHLQAPPACRQAPRSQSARLDCALQYYKPLPIAEPLSVLTVRYSPRFSNNVSLRPKTPSSRASWSASASCATGGRASRVAMVEVGNLIYW